MMDLQETILNVPDISCEHCVNTINGKLSVLPGVKSVETDIPSRTVHLWFNPAAAPLEQIEGILDEAGYTVRPTTPPSPSGK